MACCVNHWVILVTNGLTKIGVREHGCVATAGRELRKLRKPNRQGQASRPDKRYMRCARALPGHHAPRTVSAIVHEARVDKLLSPSRPRADGELV